MGLYAWQVMALTKNSQSLTKIEQWLTGKHISSIQINALGIRVIMLWNAGWILSLTDVQFYMWTTQTHTWPGGIFILLTGGSLFCHGSVFYRAYTLHLVQEQQNSHLLSYTGPALFALKWHMKSVSFHPVQGKLNLCLFSEKLFWNFSLLGWLFTISPWERHWLVTTPRENNCCCVNSIVHTEM